MRGNLADVRPYSANQIHFLSLQTAIFCVQCELISANHTPSCLACGSKAVLGLSRLFGGSLRAAVRAVDSRRRAEPYRSRAASTPCLRTSWRKKEERGEIFRHVTMLATIPSPATKTTWQCRRLSSDPALGVITERAQVLTGATGAAIALRKGDEVICRARAGRTAPDLGVRLQTGSASFR